MTHSTRRTVARRAALVVPVISAFVGLGVVGVASAQEEPSSGTIPGGIDFGDLIVVDENGVRWNVDAETGEGEIIDPIDDRAPDVVRGDGTAGTGELPNTDPASPADPANNDNGSGNGEAGKGKSSLIYVAAAAAVIVAGLGVVVMRRRRPDEDLTVIEEPMRMGHPAGNLDDLSDAASSYQGASDAGAYDVGGAAYAQYAASEGGDLAELSMAQSTTRERFEHFRESVVDRADKSLTDSGRSKPIAQKLESAGSNTRPGEWLVMAIGVTAGALAVVTFLSGIILGLVAGAVAAYGSWYRLSWQEAKRRKRFAEDLPETLQLLAGSLRGGLSMMQAIQTVSDEADEPTASEFQRLLTEARLGRDLAVSFRDLSKRMDSKDFDWVVTAIEIHREVGGDLSGILDRVGDTIRSRNRVLGQVAALSAEGKLSGLILFVLPPGMLAAISALNPEYLSDMLDESAGKILLLVSMVLLALGGLWLKKLAKFVY